MLGIRLHQGVQIDLHQGDLGVFVADAMLVPCDQERKPLGPVSEMVRVKSGLPSLLASSAHHAPLLTAAGALPATYLIHALMPPKWTGESKVDIESVERDLKASYLTSFRAFAETGKRHLAVSPLAFEGGLLSLDQSALAALATLRSFLDDQDFGQLRRISFVLSGAEDYRIFRKAMFSTFPEADQE